MVETISRKGHPGRKGANYFLVLNLRLQHPEWEAATIARELHITRERVRQILKAQGHPTRLPPKVYLCSSCGKALQWNSNKSGICRECHRKSLEYEAPCAHCGTVHARNRRLDKIKAEKGGSGRAFCSKQCQGKWLAERHGFNSPNVTEAQRLARGQSYKDRETCFKGHSLKGNMAVRRIKGKATNTCLTCERERYRRYHARKAAKEVSHDLGRA